MEAAFRCVITQFRIASTLPQRPFVICLSALSGFLVFLQPLPGLAGLFYFPIPSISTFLHFGVSLCHPPPWSRPPFSSLLGLQIVSLALGLITVLSRSVSVSFRGLPLSDRGSYRSCAHTCLHNLCLCKSSKPSVLCTDQAVKNKEFALKWPMCLLSSLI